jgi:hypothetical protein
MVLDQENKMKKIVYLFLTIFICLYFIGCKFNLNNQLLEMKDNDEISISDLTHELSGTVYVFKGGLSETTFLKYCKSFRKKDNYEFWETALLIVDEKQNANVYIIHPFYKALSTLNLIIDVNIEEPYKIDYLRIKKISKNEFELYSL